MNDALIKKLLFDVETQLNWDDNSMWTTHDFEELSEKILKETTVNLSVTTLKRLWGKINYNSKPTITTLNTLAQFIGFNNWREYKQNVEPRAAKNKTVSTKDETKISFKSKALIISLAGFIVLISSIFIFRYTATSKIISDNNSNTNSNNFSFNSKMVVPIGVPNSVIFSYDAKIAKTTDVVQIQQSWDTRLRREVPKDKKIYNSIYYYPGYFKAKLLVTDSVVREKGVLIKTDGWLPLIEKDEEKAPIYFKKESIFTTKGVMTLPVEKIEEVNVEMMPEPVWTTYFNISDFGNNTLSNNFLFETEVKNDYNEIIGVCQYINIVLYFEGAMFYIPLSFKGCVSNLSLYDTNGLMDVDVSALGFDLNEWMKIKVEVKNEFGKIFINDKFAYDFNFHFEKPAKFVGFKYNFQGTGSVNYTRFTNGNGDIVLSEDY